MIRNHVYLCRLDKKGYKRTAKNVALKQIVRGKSFFLVGANVNEYHFHTGWFLATHPDHIDIERYPKGVDDVELLYRSFAWHLDNELGRYPVFYVEI